MEDKGPFSYKNLLILISLSDHHYLNYLVANLEKHFKSTHVFNFIDHSREHGLSATESRIWELIRKNNIGLVLVIQLATDFELSPEYYSSLRELSKLAFWFFDDDMFFDSTSKYYARAADAVITTDYFPSLAYEKLGIPAVYATPIHDPELFYPVPSAKDIDVCFVGDCTKADRREYLEFLTSNGIRVETYGRGSKNGFLPGDRDISAAYSRAKIVLTFTRMDKPGWPADDPRLSGIRQNKGHYAQIALTRSFCLSEFAPSLYTIAKVGEDLAVFDSKDELLKQVRYYLAHDKEREEMADRSYETAKKTFVDTVAIPGLLNKLHEALGRRHTDPEAGTMELDPAFRSNCVNGLTFSFFILLSQGRLLRAGGLFIRFFRYGPGPFLAGFAAGAMRALTVLFHKFIGGYSRVYKK